MGREAKQRRIGQYSRLSSGAYSFENVSLVSASDIGEKATGEDTAATRSKCRYRRTIRMAAFLLLLACILRQFQILFHPLSIKDLWSEGEATRNRHRRFALMAEPRCLNATSFVLTNALEHLSKDIPVVLLHNQDNQECIKEWIQSIPTLSNAFQTGRFVHYIDSHIQPEASISPHSSIHWWNTMFTNITFWQEMKKRFGDTVLTLQSDTLICSREPPDWNFPFLGGISKGRPTDTWDLNATNTFHLNGGLSIRNIDWMIGCLQNYVQKGKIRLAEDGIFNTCRDNSTSPSVADAMHFSSDNGHTMCFTEGGERKCPWGVHKPWSLGVGRGPPIRELVEYCPAIQPLSELLGKENITGPWCIGTRCI